MNKPPNKFFRWVRFLDRIQFWHTDELVHKTHVDAARSLPDAKAFRQLSTKILQTDINYHGVNPELVDFWKSMLKHMKRRNIPVFAFEFNVSGTAVDIVHATKHWNLSKKEWDMFGAMGQEIARKRNTKMIWHGSPDQPVYDPSRWEIDE
jgi:hypothetical protein